jgi:hypothetical protein
LSEVARRADVSVDDALLAISASFLLVSFAVVTTACLHRLSRRTRRSLPHLFYTPGHPTARETLNAVMGGYGFGPRFFQESSRSQQRPHASCQGAFGLSISAQCKAHHFYRGYGSRLCSTGVLPKLNWRGEFDDRPGAKKYQDAA